MDEEKKGLMTSELLSFIRKSASVEDITGLFNGTQVEEPSFHGELYHMMLRNDVAPRKIIASSGLERSYFYHILSGQKIPGRNIVIRIALCMSASLEETNRFLQLAQHSSLYARVRRDAILIFAIENHYTMHETNELLLNENEKPLYKDNER